IQFFFALVPPAPTAGAVVPAIAPPSAGNLYPPPPVTAPRLARPPALKAGVLTVNGSNASDVILVSRAGGNLDVTANNVVYPFPFASVGAIRVNTGGGNNYVSITPDIPIPANITGGSGADILIGGAGTDSILGEGGNDVLFGGP